MSFFVFLSNVQVKVFGRVPRSHKGTSLKGAERFSWGGKPESNKSNSPWPKNDHFPPKTHDNLLFFEWNAFLTKPSVEVPHLTAGIGHWGWNGYDQCKGWGAHASWWSCGDEERLKDSNGNYTCSFEKRKILSTTFGTQFLSLIRLWDIRCLPLLRACVREWSSNWLDNQEPFVSSTLSKPLNTSKYHPNH